MGCSKPGCCFRERMPSGADEVVPLVSGLDVGSISPRDRSHGLEKDMVRIQVSSADVSFYLVKGRTESRCPVCGKICAEGEWTILVSAGGKYFLLGADPKHEVVCCGKKFKGQVAIASSQEEARKLVETFMHAIKRHTLPDAPLLGDQLATELAFDVGLLTPPSTLQ